jgi:outer membrane receptor protein involved in Fe transport
MSRHGRTDPPRNPVDSRVNLHGLTPNWSLYFTDTLTLAKTVNVTVSGRYNRFTVDNSRPHQSHCRTRLARRRLCVSAIQSRRRITWSPVSSVNAYASYTQGSRAPTAIELGCADPANPCSLPNALASDPPLQQVVTDTWEAGLRGKPEFPFLHNLNWNVGAFRAENRNDILFVSSVQLGTGYFQNFAKTRREGFDADLDGRIGRVTWGLDYTFLSATYQSTRWSTARRTIPATARSRDIPGLDGNIYVHPGNRIPLIPKQTGKAYADLPGHQETRVRPQRSGRVEFLRAREREQRVQGRWRLLSGARRFTRLCDHQLPGALRPDQTAAAAVQIDNLFNTHYYTAAQLANTGLTAQGTFLARPFPEYTPARRPEITRCRARRSFTAIARAWAPRASSAKATLRGRATVRRSTSLRTA